MLVTKWHDSVAASNSLAVGGGQDIAFPILQLKVGLLLAVRRGVSSSKGFVPLTAEHYSITVINAVFYFWVILRRLNFVSTFRNNLFHLHRWCKAEELLWFKRRFKRQHIKIRRRGITKKKEYIIQNAAKVLNEEGAEYCRRGSVIAVPCLGCPTS